MSHETHNPDKIVQEANEKFTNNDLSGAQMLYQTALLEWVDDASFGASDPETVKHIAEGVAKLWIEFANLNCKANMVSLIMECLGYVYAYSFYFRILTHSLLSDGTVWSCLTLKLIVQIRNRYF